MDTSPVAVFSLPPNFEWFLHRSLDGDSRVAVYSVVRRNIFP